MLAFILDVDDTLLKEVAIKHRVHECAQLLRYKPSDANVTRYKRRRVEAIEE